MTSEAREILYAEFAAMEQRREFVRGPMGDGRDAEGRLFSIHRYTSRTTGKRYDVIHAPGDSEPRCVEYPKYDPSEQQ